MNLSQMKRTIARHLMMKNYDAYEWVLKAIKARGDIWMTSQGEYMRWWRNRANASMEVTAADGLCRVDSSLENAVFEKFPGEFLSSKVIQCKETDFSGKVWLIIESALDGKELLIELLKREGILNFRVAKDGEFLLSRQEMAPLLAEIDAKLRKRGRLFEADVEAVRQVITDKLAERGLPLLRLWYHPRVDGTVVKAVFSPRHDVDRAITNMACILKLEQEYGVTSTIYLRAFCPFYSDRDVQALASSAWCAEIALHGEFVRNARRYGGESSAARVEKEWLEALIGRPVFGLSMHGGEGTYNISQDNPDAVEWNGFLYDTTPAMRYYFPVRPVEDGRMRRFHIMNHAFGDIKVLPGRNYARDLYQKVMEKMDEVYEQNGIFVLTLHPVYFDFLSYLLHPKRFVRLAAFFWNRLMSTSL